MPESTVFPAADRLPLRLEDGETGYRLVRAWPRSPQHLLTEWERTTEGTPSGTVVGQWFADPAALDAAARETQAPAHRLGPVLLQPEGTDARLPALAEVLREPGAQLIGHRPGRRAVARVPGPDGDVFVKVVRRPRRAEDVMRRGQLAQRLVDGQVVVPTLVGADIPRGVVCWGDVGGRTLSDLGPSWSPADAYRAWERAGRAVAVLHAADQELVEDRHDDDAEVAGADRWLGPAVAHGRLDPGTVTRARERVLAALADLRGEPALGVLHRDLHDRQVLLRPDGRVGLIDVDTLAVGERAVDLANVLVHLELRQAQGLLGADAAEAAWQGMCAGIVDGAPAGQQEVTARALRRLPTYVLACRLRMAAIYSFRPQWHDLARALLRAVTEGAGLDGEPVGLGRPGSAGLAQSASRSAHRRPASPPQASQATRPGEG